MSKEHGHSCCSASCGSSGLQQTLDELEFEKSIFFACVNGDLERCKHLIDKQGRSIVDHQDQSGYTPLAYAARNNQLKICQLLVATNADPNLKTKSNQMTPLHRATLMGHSEVVKLLAGYKRTDLFAKDADDRTALQICLEKLNGLKEQMSLMNPRVDFSGLDDNAKLDAVLLSLTQLIESNQVVPEGQKNKQLTINLLKIAQLFLFAYKQNQATYLFAKIAKLDDLSPLEFLVTLLSNNR